MSLSSERDMLLQHGTKAFVLKPSAILGAATNDLKIKRLKAAGYEEGNRPYAFHRDHVKKAKTVRELLDLALDDPDRGVESAKYNTRMIYSDLDLLRGARELADDVEPAEVAQEPAQMEAAV